MGDGYSPPDMCPPPLLMPSGDHQNKYGWQAGGMHPTRLLSCYFCFWERLKIICFVLFFIFRTCFAKMELVIDLKIDSKLSSYRNVIIDFGYFRKITGESVRIVLVVFQKSSHDATIFTTRNGS